MKCVTCKRPKKPGEFPLRNKQTGKRHSKCKECQKKYSRAHYKANKGRHNKRRAERREEYKARNLKLVEEYLKAHPCVDCGSTDHRVLDFDHVYHPRIDSVTSLAWRGCGEQLIRDEIAKCEVRCANCHRIRHYKERNGL